VLFNSYTYILFFLPLVVAGYFSVNRRKGERWAIVWLVAASLLFYGWWKPVYLPLLLFSIGFNFWVGCHLPRAAERRRRALLRLGITVNLGLLAYFKYAGFVVANVNTLFDTDFAVGPIVLPLAISFFTFQQVAYLVDSARGLTKEYDFWRYSLFVAFFPQLIAGPIVHHAEVLPQFADEKRHRKIAENLVVGIVIFVIGLWKKVMVADTVAGYATPVFTAVEQGYGPTVVEAWTAALAYALQIYFDFSGYSDMAIGSARLFGIRLPLNFHSPYKADNIIEFWRRWHMTLSRFLRDYLYIPLGGNRKGTLWRFVNVFITMFLGGLWHGAGWNFIIWGVLHAAYMFVNHLWHRIVPAAGGKHWWSVAAARVCTLVAVIVAWVFFRAETLAGALRMLKGMAGGNGMVVPQKYLARWGEVGEWLAVHGVAFQTTRFLTSLTPLVNLVILLVLCASLLPNTQEIMARYEPALGYGGAGPRRWYEFSIRPLTAVAGAGLFLVSFFHLTRVSAFLYFNF